MGCRRNAIGGTPVIRPRVSAIKQAGRGFSRSRCRCQPRHLSALAADGQVGARRNQLRRTS